MIDGGATLTVNIDEALILIVEDDLATKEFLVESLKIAGFEILAAGSAGEGLRTARHATPDLILLDVMLPDGDGYDVSRQLRTNPETADIPVVFLTGRHDLADRLAGFEAGGVDYIPKPAHIPEVLARISAHIEQRRLRAELRRLNSTLEQKVADRTEELTRANAALQEEMALRQQHQAEKDRLFDLVAEQSDHLRQLTLSLMRTQQQRSHAMAQTWLRQVNDHVESVTHSLGLAIDVLAGNGAGNGHASHVRRHIEMAVQTLGRVKTYLSGVEEQLAEPVGLPDHAILELSTREQEVLHLIAQGKSVKEIAELLDVSPSTVYTHRRRLMRKLDVEQTADLLKVAMEVIHA
jgi:DNA-binding NarL/FixJ family response regulator